MGKILAAGKELISQCRALWDTEEVALRRRNVGKTLLKAPTSAELTRCSFLPRVHDWDWEDGIWRSVTAKCAGAKRVVTLVLESPAPVNFKSPDVGMGRSALHTDIPC